MSQAKVAGPPWARAPPRSALRGCLRRKWPDHLSSGHLETQSCEDVSGGSGLNYGAGHIRGQRCEDVSNENGLNTSAQGIPEPRVARMLQAKVARPQWGRALPRSDLRGCRRRQWPEHLTSGRLGTQSCEDISGENGRTTMGQGTSEVRVVRRSHAKMV